jgi:hypothetical protein
MMQEINFNANLKQLCLERAVARTANKGFAIAGVPCFADTHLCKVEVQFSE